MAFNNKPVRYYRQPLLPVHPSPQTSRLSGAMMILGLSLSAAFLFPTNEKAALSPASFVPAPIEIQANEADATEQPQVVVDQSTELVPTREETIEERKAMLAQRISKTYRRPLAEVERIVDYAHVSGERHDIDPVLLLAIAAVESSFNPRAVSSAGAQGLIQALPRAHPEKFARLRAKGKTPFDPDASLDMGGQIYAEYRTKFNGNQVLALQQYNGSLKDKSRRYSSKVLAMYRQLSVGLPSLPNEA